MIKSETTATDEKPKKRLVPIVLGFVCMLPAVIACGMSQLLLSIGTLMTSVQKVSLGPPIFIGGENYARLLQLPAFWKATGFSLGTLLVYLLAAAVVPALLAWGACALGLRPRTALRVLFTIPAALFFPVGLALLWRGSFKIGKLQMKRQVDRNPRAKVRSSDEGCQVQSLCKMIAAVGNQPTDIQGRTFALVSAHGSVAFFDPPANGAFGGVIGAI